MRSFTHINARTIGEACLLLGRYRCKARLNAGGTDLLTVLKAEILPEYPQAIINVKNIPGLDYIIEDGGLLRIGALTLLSDAARSPLLRERYGVLAEAAHSVATPQIRNVATVGGNLCQNVRCWYYRYPGQIGGFMQCARKGSGPCLAVRGDNRYHAIMGGKKCFAVCPSDMAVALAALDGRMTLISPKGERTVSVADFFNPMGNALKRGEMVREITVPQLKGQEKQVFLKFTLRKPVDFAIVSVATVTTVQGGLCTDARIALGAVAPGPVRSGKGEAMLIGRPLDEEAALQSAELALSDARPLSKNAYKIEIAKTLVKRAILHCC